MTVEFRTAYGPHQRVALVFELPTMTEQSHKKACDIQNIIRQFDRGVLWEHLNRYPGNYEDVSHGLDYQEAVLMIQAADEMFLSLPAGLRARFSNDPGEFLDFVGNEENADEMRELGLLKPEVSPAEPVSTGGEPDASGASVPAQEPAGED